MSSRYRHRRTPLAATPFPSPVEPGEIVVNTANRQIAVGDASAGTLGQPKQLIAVRYFDVTAAYVLNDLAVQTGKVYRANGNIPPGAFNATNWTDIGGSATAALVTFSPGGNVSSTNVQAAIAELDSEKAAVTYVDAADANLAASTQAGFDAQTTAVAAKAPIASPTFTGDPKAPTPAPGDNDTSIATTAFVAAAAAASVTGKVDKAGDTMTGDLTIAKANPAFNLNKAAAGQTAVIRGQLNGLRQWALELGTSNSSADFLFTCYDDAGNLAFTPLLGIRATGLLSVQADPTAALGVATKQYVDARAATATAAEYVANSAPGKMLTPGAAWAAANNVNVIVALTAYAPDFNSAIDFVWVLSAAGSTLLNPTNVKPGQKGMIYFFQDGTGGRTITTWGSNWKFPGGVKPVLSTAPNAFDAMSYAVYNNAPSIIACNFSAGFA